MRTIIIAPLLALSVGADAAAAETTALALAGAADNDLYRVLAASHLPCRRFDTASEAVAAAVTGSSVLLLADDYPKHPTVLEPELFETAAEKDLRLYVEFPETLPGFEVGKPTPTHVERGVVATGFFGKALPELSIVSVNGLHYVPIAAASPHLVAARVAGFDHAVYGLPEATVPLLFEMPDREVLVAATKLSGCITGRYAPQASWQAIWSRILAWLLPGQAIPPLTWTPTVRATYGRDEALPTDCERRAISRALQWYDQAKMIVHPSFAEQIAGVERVPRLPPDAPLGDGSLGALEAVLSVIHDDGAQALSTVQRTDCIAETAMAMAFGGRLLGDGRRRATAERLLDYLYFTSAARQRERGDPANGNYGLIAWGLTTPAWYKANYGDDDARVMLSTMAAAALSGSDRWDQALMMCLLANLRTTGRLGFRGNRIDVGQLNNGWEPFFLARRVNPAPHFEAYLWACYLWAYAQTGWELFLERAETALTLTMAARTDGWRWTNGLAQERARMLLPLAWLVRVKDTPAHRAMLRQAVAGLLALQDESGAIREELGLPGRGAYPPPRSNAAYGTTEASLIAENGDPVSDLLYTTNFAFLGLHEAAAATGDADIDEAEDKLAQFLCRIQVRSDTRPQVDGGWFRAFDFGRWEHWGCNADHGWGAWAIESGWTQGWITSVLAMRQMGTSLWNLTRDSHVGRYHEQLRRQMIPDETLASLEDAAAAVRVAHDGVGKRVTLTTMPSPSYFGLGAKSLVDGRVGDLDHASGLWLGFHADDLEAVIDVGETRLVRQVAVRFLKSVALGIYLPREVAMEVSEDGEHYRPVAAVRPSAREAEGGPLVETVRFGSLDVPARYVRVVARSLRIIPSGRPAAGRKAWLFADEIMVNPVPAAGSGRANGRPPQ